MRLDPAEPREASKTRPCIIVSNEGANVAVTKYGRGTLTVVPLSSNVRNTRGEFQVHIDNHEALEQMGLSRASKAQAEQVRTVPVDRCTASLGWTPHWVMHQVDSALRFHLSL